MRRLLFTSTIVLAVLGLAAIVSVGAACYRAAAAAGVLTSGRIAGSLLLGAALMATPIILLKLKDRPYFRQT